MSHPPPELARALTPSCNDEDVLAVLKWRTSNEPSILCKSLCAFPGVAVENSEPHLC